MRRMTSKRNLIRRKSTAMSVDPDALPTTTSPPPDGAGRLTLYYVLALSAVALLSLVGQWLVQTRLERQLGDSRTVNVAGRQRMLSQRICKCALLVARERRGPALQELRDSMTTWHRSQDDLRRGRAGSGRAEENSAEVSTTFARLEPAFIAMHDAARRIVEVCDSSVTDEVAQWEIAAQVPRLLENERTFLEGMDSIVALYEREAQQRVERLQRVELVLLILTLSTLLLEGALVFRPAARRIRESFAALVRLGEQLRGAKDEAESANRAKSRFLTNMSHELRTPLHAILGAAEVLEKRNSVGADNEYLQLIEDSGRTLLRLVNDLLDLAKIEAGKLELLPAPVDLRAFVEGAAAQFRELAARRGLRFGLAIDERAPRRIFVDELRLGQVLSNLLGNAFKFTELGAVNFYVAVEPAEAAPSSPSGRVRLCFAVRDTGIGIHETELSKIFDSFTQADASIRRRREGAGLGLAISTQLATLMNGRLEVESRPGFGSCFSFIVDCEVCATAAYDDGVPTAPADRATPMKLRPCKILAVDDATAGRRVLETLLSDAGHLPICAADGRQALELFERDSFDLVLLDLHMPMLDGRTTAAAMRRYEREQGQPRTPIVLLTADATVVNSYPPQLGDFDAFLLKPFSDEMLCAVLASRIDSLAQHAAATPSSADDAVCSRRDRILSRLQGNQSLLAELVGLFLQEGPSLLDRIARAISTLDRTDLFTTAHLLRGQLEMLELTVAAKQTLQLESGAAKDSGPMLMQTFRELESTWDEIRSQAESLLSITIRQLTSDNPTSCIPRC
ncbi:MAG: hypothetical protein C0483_23230 [Pirellula sp.]|nr:hypothetical protein [Pirellula sp.]